MKPRCSRTAPAGNQAAADPSCSLCPGSFLLPATGFSLIEILVVIVILAVTAAAVTLAVGDVGERRLARDAERLQALLGYACEQAELSGRQIGLSLDRDGYRFSRADHADWLLERDG